MHKGVILLVKAENKEDALEQVENFMEPYGNGLVWDWYQIGGRWNNTLAPKDLIDQYNIIVDNQILIKEDELPFISQRQVDNNQERLQKEWENLGLKGKNSYCNHYQLSDEGNYYDVVKLEDCLETVKEWVKDLDKEKENCWNEMMQAKEDAKQGKYDMSGYYAGIYKNLDYGEFSFESNVFDITKNEAEEIPDEAEIKDYFAVMVDMHN